MREEMTAQEIAIREWIKKERKLFDNDNQAWITGVIMEEFHFDHRTYSKNYYRTKVAVRRRSGVVDEIPMIVSQDLVENISDDTFKGKYISAKGEFCSYNEYEGGKSHLQLYLLARNIKFYEQERN